MGACACPEIPLPDVWLPWVIKHRGQVENAAQADAIADILFAHFKACLAQMHEDAIQLPAYAKYVDQGPINKGADESNTAEALILDANSETALISENTPLSQWCEGLLMAHTATEKFWQGAWNKMQQQNPDAAPAMAKNLKHCLLVF